MESANAVFDENTLRRLVEDTDSRSFVMELARTYLQLLRPRVQRIAVTIAAVDIEAALDAARSLKGSSRMTGALELAELATLIQEDLNRDDLETSLARVAELPEAARRADEAITAFVTQTENTAVAGAAPAAAGPPQPSSDSIR